MTTVKISGLPPITAANALDADLVPIVSSYTGTATTYKITTAQLRVQLSEGAQTFTGLVTAQSGLSVAGATTLVGAVGIVGAVTVTGAAAPFSATNPAPTALHQVLSSAGTTTGAANLSLANTGNSCLFGIESSAGGVLYTGTSAYSSVFGTASARSVHLVTNNAVRLTIDSAGATSLAAGLTVASGVTVTAGGLTVSAGLTAIQALTAASLVTLNGGLTVASAATFGSGLSVTGGDLQIGAGLNLILLGLGGGTHIVSVGAADSGGVGFKLLRVPN